MTIFSAPSKLDAQFERVYRIYGSTDYNHEQYLGLPDLRQSHGEYIASIPTYYDASDTEVLELKVVFHVLQPLGEPPVSRDRIELQIERLNVAFNSSIDAPENVPNQLVEAFDMLKTNPRIEFCLAGRGLLGEDFGGINVKPLLQLPQLSSINGIKDDLLGISPWDVERYINVWVVPMPDYVSGLAQYPVLDPLFDGIVIDPQFLATDLNKDGFYNHGNTLVHLMANYLGLKPIWGQTQCDGDQLSDTPTSNAPNFGPAIANHYTTCSRNTLEMSTNFMDNTDDEYQYIWTQQQVKVMRHALSTEGPRNGLVSNTVCATNNDELVSSASFDDLSSNPQLGIRFFPNPVSALLNVEVKDLPGNSGKIRLINSSGRVFIERDLTGSFQQLNLSDIPVGLYFLQVSGDGDQIVKRVVVN